MSQIRQRQVKVQITSADPLGKVFKGIYADSGYKSLLTSSKTYNFKINSGQTKELYIRYSQKPITITFKKSNIGAEYIVEGSFGTVSVGKDDVIKTIEFPTDTTSSMGVKFERVYVKDSDSYELTSFLIDDSVVELPHSMSEVTPGTNIQFSVYIQNVTTTTTSTKPPTTTTTSSTTPTPPPPKPKTATLLFKKDSSGLAYDIGGSFGINYVGGEDKSIIIQDPVGSENISYEIGSINPDNNNYHLKQVRIAGIVRELPHRGTAKAGDTVIIQPTFEVISTTTTSSTTTNPPTTTTSTIDPTITTTSTDFPTTTSTFYVAMKVTNLGKETIEVTGPNNSSDGLTGSPPITPNTSIFFNSNGDYIGIKLSGDKLFMGEYPDECIVKDAKTEKKIDFTYNQHFYNYDYSKLLSSGVKEITVTTDLDGTTTTTTSTSTTPPTTTTTTPPPAVLKLQSNASGTVVEVTSDGIIPEEVNLAGTTQSTVKIDMKNAPLVNS